jgi:hypothetical protein
MLNSESLAFGIEVSQAEFHGCSAKRNNCIPSPGAKEWDPQAQHPKPIVARFGFDLLFITSSRANPVALDFQVATIAFIADQTFVAATRLLSLVRDDRFRNEDRISIVD